MQVLEGQHDLSRIEDDLLLGEAILLFQVVEQGAAALIVKHQVEIRLALERVMQLEYEWVLQRHQDLLLQLDVLKVVLFFQDGLVEDLHGVVAARPVVFPLLNEEDFCKAALAQQTDDAYGPQVDILAEIGRCIWATSFNDIIIQSDSLLNRLPI